MKSVAKKIFTAAAALFVCFFLNGNQVKIDLLENRLKQSADNEKPALLNQLSYLLIESDTSSAIEYAENALQLSKQWKLYGQEAIALENLAMIQKYKKDSEKALCYFQQARSVFKENDDKEGLAGNLVKTALMHESKLNFSSAANFYKDSLAVQRELGNKREMASLMTKIGTLAGQRSLPLEALEYFLMALDIYRESENVEAISLRLTSTGKIYSKPEQYLIDLQQYLQSQDMLNPVDTGLNMIYVYNNIGKTYTELENFEKAEFYLNKAHQIIEKNSRAEKAAVREHYLFFSQLYSELGQFEEAHGYLRSYIDLKDAIFTVDSDTMIKEMGKKYDNTQIALESGRVRKKFFQLLTFFSLGFILLFLAGVFFYLRYRQKLKEREMKRRINFFMNLAHEIKTPLTLIRSYFSRYAAKQKPSESLELIGTNLDSLINYILNFFTLEKLERGQIIYNHEQKVNVHSVCEKMAALTESACEEKGLELTYEGTGAACFIRIDPDALNTILFNLLQNAVKYTGRGGKIQVVLQEHGNKVKLTIKDTGIGIDDKDLTSVFKPFARLLADKRRIGGLGLGLSIVKNIIDQIRGRIELKSKAGEGTACTVFFEKSPAGADEVAADTVELSQISVQKTVEYKPVSYKKSRPTILIVEDEPDLLYCLQELFLEELFNAYTAVNGKDALEKLKTIPKPDVIIADIMMDVMNGYVLFDYIRQSASYNSIPFVFLSARTADSEILKGLGLGAVEYIPKPFDNKKLVARVRAIIGYTRKKEQSIRKESTKIAQDIKCMPISEKVCLKFDITDRQKDILRLKQQGFKYNKIAETLGISTGAVKAQVHLIKKKTDINDINTLLQMFFYNTDSRRYVPAAPTSCLGEQ